MRPVIVDRAALHLERRGRFFGYALLAPYGLLLTMLLIFPIATFLTRAVDNRPTADSLPRTAEVLSQWQSPATVPDLAYKALIQDVAVIGGRDKVASLGRRLNYDLNGLRSMIIKLAARPFGDGRDARAELIALDPRWGDVEVWATLKQETGQLTASFILSAVDMEQATDGSIINKHTDQSIFRFSLWTTLSISLSVTAICLVIGFPVAHFLTTVPPKRLGIFMIFVLLPFWTSLLVRTSAWIVLLQREGPVNTLLQWTGLIGAPLALLHNRTGVLIVMVHVLLPFMILSIYACMVAIPRDYVRAARSLGGGPVKIFWRIYLPQTYPGIGAGCLLVFILALGYYVTPLLVGGPRDQMISSYVAFYTNQTINWGLASALGLVLILIAAISYAVITRLTRTRGPLDTA